MQHAKESAFLDLLYDATVDPDLWTPAMAQFSDIVRGGGVWLSQVSVADGTGADVGVYARFDPQAYEHYERYYHALNPYSNEEDPVAYMANWRPRVLCGEAWISRDDLRRTEYYNDFMLAFGMDHTLIVRLAAQGFSVSAVTVGRPKGRDGFDADDLAVAERLRSHIARALRLTQKLTEAGLRSPDVEAALNRSPYGIFALDRDGLVRRTNRMADRILAQRLGLSVIGRRLCASQGAAARQLEQLIGAAASRDPLVRTGGSMTLPARGGRTPLGITVTPVRGSTIALFGEAPAVLVCVTDPDARGEVDAAQLQALFGFTPAEARVALALMDGATAREAASRLGVSFHTVRHQIQSLLDKTGAPRQADLLALLTRAAAGPAG